MLNFHYRNPARIFFGDGAENNMYDLLKEYKVTSLMFVYSGDFIKTLGIWDVIKDACDRLGIDFQECGEVVPNPKIELIRDLVKVCKEHKTDFVLAAGGGSSVDTENLSHLVFLMMEMYGISLMDPPLLKQQFRLEQSQHFRQVVLRHLMQRSFPTD